MIFEGLDIEFLNVFIAIAAIVTVYFAWKSTNVRDIQPTAVLIIENNRRRLLENIIRPQSTNIENATEETNQSENQRSEILNNIDTPAPSLHDVLEEVTDLAMSVGSRLSSSSTETNTEEIFEENNDTGPQEIIQNMDNTTDEPNSSEGIRRRRLAFYAQENQNENDNNETNIRRENLNLHATGDSTHAENCSNENNENENISKSESNRNQNDQSDGASNINEINNAATNQTNNDEFVIKLKYLNDDLRLVKGSPQEALGDFKKRNFTVELEAEKLVRLVFNGHVLQPDTKTLQACGLFDNCVVHCLVHKRTMQSNHTGGSNVQQDHHDNQTNNNNAQTRSRTTNGMNFRPGLTNGPLFVYFAVGVTSMAIIFSWYCRFQYSSLFSLYSTIGLIFMTALFLLIFPLVILIERDVPV